MLNWRKDKPVIHKGKTVQFVPENNVYVFFRYTDSERIMVVINNNPEKQTLDLSRFEEMLNGFDSGFEVISNQKIVLNKELVVGGKSSMIIEQMK